MAVRRGGRLGDRPDKEYIEETFASGGAWLVGRTMHDVVDGWGDDPGFGVPVFVVTHRPTRGHQGRHDIRVRHGRDHVALDKARAAAGGKNVVVMGGADLLRQYLNAGVVDELTFTIAPVLLGEGKRLFDGIERTDLVFERTP